MKNGMKFLLMLLLLTFAYYYISKYFSKNHQFIQYYRLYSNSVQDAKKKEVFIDYLDLNEIEVIGNSEFKKFILDSLVFWKEKVLVKTQYGFLPLSAGYKEVEGEIGINFQPNKELFTEPYPKYIKRISVKKGYFSHDLVHMVRYVVPENYADTLCFKRKEFDTLGWVVFRKHKD